MKKYFCHLNLNLNEIFEIFEIFLNLPWNHHTFFFIIDTNDRIRNKTII